MTSKLQLTFAMIKPSTVKNPFALQEILNLLHDNKFEIVKSKMVNLTKKDAASFYCSHEGKFYYNRLVTFMTR